MPASTVKEDIIIAFSCHRERQFLSEPEDLKYVKLKIMPLLLTRHIRTRLKRVRKRVL